MRRGPRPTIDEGTDQIRHLVATTLELGPQGRAVRPRVVTMTVDACGRRAETAKDAPAPSGAEQWVRHVSADRIIELWAVCEVVPADSSRW
ncbi:hypothetical protein ACQP0C_33335 [Nocardia sp. CA-129566]|uniref:hypothetical protein n=1 Tax=Nocardia sp. CA-129566 TaxID=3239976 RepID=UPI003D98F10C